MTAVAVTFDGTRVNAADDNTDWGNFDSTGPTPAAEPQNAYQNALAVNKKITSTGSLAGIDYDPGANPLDMVAAANRLWFLKMYVADFGDLAAGEGLDAAIGSGNGDYHNYTMAGTIANLSVYDTYPDQGGYLITSIDPNIAVWRANTTGTPILTAVDYFGGRVRFLNGSAKNENFAIDSIDVGTGLTVSGNNRDFSYSTNSFSVATQDDGPLGLAFNTDGTKFFIVGDQNDTIFEYTVSTGFDLSSTVAYSGNSFSIASEEIFPQTIAFNNDGTKFFITGAQNDTVYEYTVSTGFDLSSTVAYSTNSFSVSTQDNQPRGISFNSNGTKFFIVGAENDTVYEYTVSTGFDLSSTVAYSGNSFSIASEDFAPQSLIFNADGTRFFVLGSQNDNVYEYLLDVGFDLSSAIVYSGTSYSVATQDGAPKALYFNPDGTQFFVTGDTNDTVYEYTLDNVGTPSFASFVATDQDILVNRWGVVTGSGNIIRAIGLLTIDGSTAAEFTDNDSVVIFPDGYHSAGLLGVDVITEDDGNVININSLFIGEGSVQTLAADDTRPDFTIRGTSPLGNVDCSPSIRNFRNVMFINLVDVFDFDIECQLLVQAGCHIRSGIIRTNAVSAIACLQDPTFGSTTGLHDVEFIQTGVGHALEIDTLGGHDLNNITFVDYGADTTNDAAVFVSAPSGTVTITVIGGDIPTFRTAGATVVIINNPVTLIFTVLDQDTTLPIENAAVTALASTGGSEPFEEVVTISQSAGVATVVHTAHGFSTGKKVGIENANENNYNRIKTVTVVDSDSYTYPIDAGTASPATGTILATSIIVDGLTDISGNISDTRSYLSNQPIVGDSRKGSSAPTYKATPFTGTIDSNNGLLITVLMPPD